MEKLVWKDFNIENVAGGVDKVFIIESPAVVGDKTLEIRFQWVGKGTTCVPDRGNYGPLISAISVEADFMHPSEDATSIRKETKESTFSGKTIFIVVGIVASVLCLLLLVLGIGWWKSSFRRGTSMEKGGNESTA
ncbi:hypothetical protein HHK36_005204 [Tetracentron sinense]|uniref:Malectin domain-containing protein n=1 Tax=Tetracentron sinense TaxID=13715 RepID=A0A834ZTQ7_TETSI|nr:hypothetical protein HHK36_005204 [Tetracentron sinense]